MTWFSMKAIAETPSTRFVILHHRLADGEHWDLMLEHEGVLLTWQLAENPILAGDGPLPARRIADHRVFYLDYEGPVSKDRGSVRPIVAGKVQFLELSPQLCRFKLFDSAFSGEFRLESPQSGVWIFARN
jgi:hypothetical protein